MQPPFSSLIPCLVILFPNLALKQVVESFWACEPNMHCLTGLKSTVVPLCIHSLGAGILHRQVLPWFISITQTYAMVDVVAIAGEFKARIEGIGLFTDCLNQNVNRHAKPSPQLKGEPLLRRNLMSLVDWRSWLSLTPRDFGDLFLVSSKIDNEQSFWSSPAESFRTSFRGPL